MKWTTYNLIHKQCVYSLLINHYYINYCIFTSDLGLFYLQYFPSVDAQISSNLGTRTEKEIFAVYMNYWQYGNTKQQKLKENKDREREEKMLLIKRFLLFLVI